MIVTNCARFKSALAGFTAYLSGIGSGLAEAIGSACAQKLHGVIPPFQLNAGRYAAQILMSICLVMLVWTDVRISYIKVPWVILLSVLSVIYNTAFYTAAMYLPLSTLMLINLSVIYMGTIILSKIFLYKQTVCFQYIAFLVLLLGQCLLLQPCFIFSTVRCYNNFSFSNNDSFKSITPVMKPDTLPSPFIGYILVIVASSVAAIRTFVYRCQVSEVPTSVLCFWTSTLGLILSLISMFYTENPNITLGKLDIWLLFGHAGFASCSSLLLAHSQQNLHPLIFSILLNSKVVFSFILQFTFPQVFMQSVPNIWEFLGVLLCVLGAVSYVLINFRIEQNNTI